MADTELGKEEVTQMRIRAADDCLGPQTRRAVPIDIPFVQPDALRLIFDGDEYDGILFECLPASQDEQSSRSFKLTKGGTRT